MEKASMKKAFLYAFVAVVLGVGIMLFPLWTFFRSYNEEGPIVGAPIAIGPIEIESFPVIKPMYASPNWLNYTMTLADRDMSTFGIPKVDNSEQTKVQIQSKSADASLQILAIGFVAAMAVYLMVRRKAPRPVYRFPPV
jgi:hypothetical protein